MELVEAVAALRASRPRLRCYLLGSGPDQPALQQAVARLKLEDVVSFVPAAPTETVAQWMAASDAVTLPSYKEGCPNVVIEALAAGRPMVATRVGGIPELMDERVGRLVPPADAKALATALEETLSASWKSEEIAALHRRSWQDVADDLFAVLEKTLAKR